MKVFADFHHDDLFHSLHLLFEKRLGWELYAPCGSEWYTSGYWKYSPEPRVVSEFLVEKQFEDTGKGYCLVNNPCHGRKLKALTFDQFKKMDIDIIISSVPEHEIIYYNLAKKYQPKAKLIQHWGNEWKKFKPAVIKNWMVSCAPFSVPSDVLAVFYHQEFDLDVFSWTEGSPKSPIKSFVNDLPHLKDWELFKRYEKALSDWKWQSYGLGCREGNARPLSKYVETMKKSSFIFHAKSLGDGFGHVIHNAFALGRPPIVRSSYYRGRLAESLFIDGVTCIDLDAHTFDQNCQLIKACSGPGKYHQMNIDARHRFEDVVDFNSEFKIIKKFLEGLR